MVLFTCFKCRFLKFKLFLNIQLIRLDFRRPHMEDFLGLRPLI